MVLLIDMADRRGVAAGVCGRACPCIRRPAVCLRGGSPYPPSVRHLGLPVAIDLGDRDLGQAMTPEERQ